MSWNILKVIPSSTKDNNIASHDTGNPPQTEGRVIFFFFFFLEGGFVVSWEFEWDMGYTLGVKSGS